MAGSTIRIAILADAAQARRELGSTTSAASRIGEGFRKAALPAAAALGALGAAAVKAAQAASLDDAAQSRLAQTLRTAAGATKEQVVATESWITKQGKALGVTDDELRPALGRLAVATGSVSKAQKLASLAMDISAGSGKSLSSVTEALAKAQNGNLGGLSRLGVATKDAAGETLSLKQITSDLADTYKGAASTAADTAAGRQRKLGVQLGELQEQIGARLLPVLERMAEVGLRAVDWIAKNEGKVTAAVAAFAGLAATVLVVNAAMKVASAATAIYHGVTVAVRGVTLAWTAAQWLLNVAMTANPIGLVVVAIAAMVAAVVIAWQHSETFRKIVLAAWGAVEAAAKALKSAVVGALGPVVEKITGLKEKITGAFTTAKTWLAAKGREIVTGLIGGIGDKIADLGAKVIEARAKINEKFANAVSFLLAEGRQIITGLIGGIGEKLSDLGSKVIDAKNRILDKFANAVEFLVAEGRQVIAGLMSGIGARFEDLKAKVGEAKDKIVGMFASAGSWLYGAGKSIIQGLIDGLQALWEQLLAWIKKIIDKIKSIPGVPGIGGLTIDVSGTSAVQALAAVKPPPPAQLNVTVQSPVGSSPADIGRTLTRYIDIYQRSGGRRLA